MKITIKALSGETNAENINILDGIDCQDDFVEYMDEEDYPFVSKLEYGYMSFKVEDGKLYTITEYGLIEGKTLSDEEIDKLIDYTQGQWSDGIGEGFEQEPCVEENDEEVYVSPWYSKQVATAVISD